MLTLFSSSGLRAKACNGARTAHPMITARKETRMRSGRLVFFLFDLFQEFFFCLAGNATSRKRHRLQPLFADFHSAIGADPVSAFIDTDQRLIDVLAHAVTHFED